MAVIAVVAIFPGAAAASAPYPIYSSDYHSLCVGVRGSHYSDVAEIGLCFPTLTQEWSVRSATTVGGGYAVQLQNGYVVDGVPACLGVAGSSGSDGAQAWVGKCSSDAAGDHSQAWRFGYYSGGVLKYRTSLDPNWVYFNVWLVNGHSGLCLDMYGDHPTSGNYLVQTTCSESDHLQQWDLSS